MGGGSSGRSVWAGTRNSARHRSARCDRSRRLPGGSHGGRRSSVRHLDYAEPDEPTSGPGRVREERSLELGEASARRSVSRVLSRRAEARRRRWPSICGRRSPDGSCGRPEGWAAHLSPAGHPVRVAPSYLALLRVEFAAFHSAVRPESRARHRHCGTGPRLATDGRYPPPCAEELGLSSRRDRVAPAVPRSHPTASLTGGFYSWHGSKARAGPEVACPWTISMSLTTPVPPLTSRSSTTPTPGAYSLSSSRSGSSGVKSSVTRTSDTCPRAP